MSLISWDIQHCPLTNGAARPLAAGAIQGEARIRVLRRRANDRSICASPRGTARQRLAAAALQPQGRGAQVAGRALFSIGGFPQRVVR